MLLKKHSANSGNNVYLLSFPLAGSERLSAKTRIENLSFKKGLRTSRNDRNERKAIGWFLHTSAQASYQQASLQETLSNVKVKDIMAKNIVTVSQNITIETAIDEYFMKYGYGGFPVVDNRRFLGLLTLKEIKNIPKERWKDVRISEIFIPHDKKWEVSEEEDAMKALERMISEDKGRLSVTEKGNLIGLITRNGIAKYVQIKGEIRR